MTVVGSAEITIKPEFGNFQRELESKINGHAKTASGAFSKGFSDDLNQRGPKIAEESTRGLGNGIKSQIGGIAKAAAAALGAAFVVNKGFDFLQSSVAEARESNKVAAQTEAVIKSTGGAAKVTAGDIDRLSTAISNKTGIDDEAIATASNLLLTFTNVRNEVGKGNDIFNQATQIATDMGAALGTDASASAIQLGKALNDPIAGISALSRVGVTFSQQQKDQIKNFVDQGKTAEAQKVILAELTKEFGGSAAAQATSAQKLSVAWGNIKEQVGNALIPILDRLASFLSAKLPGAIATAQRVIGGIVQAVKDFVHGFRVGIDSLSDPQTKAAQLGAQFYEIWVKIRPVIMQVGEFIRDHLKPILIGLGVAFLAITSPVTLVVGGLALLYARSQTVRDIVAAVADFIQTKLIPAFKTTVDWINKNLVPTFKAGFEAIRAIVETVVGIIVDLWDRFGSHLVDHIVTHLNAVKQIFEGIFQVIRGIFDVFAGVFTGDWSRVWEGIKGIFGGVFNALSGIVKDALNTVSTVIGGAMAVISAAWSAVWGGMRSIVDHVFDGLAGAFRGVVNLVLTGLETAINTAIGLLNKSLDAIDKALGPKINLGEIPTVSLPRITEPGNPITSGPSRPESDRAPAAGSLPQTSRTGQLQGNTFNVVYQLPPDDPMTYARESELKLRELAVLGPFA